MKNKQGELYCRSHLAAMTSGCICCLVAQPYSIWNIGLGIATCYATDNIINMPMQDTQRVTTIEIDTRRNPWQITSQTIQLEERS